MWREEDTDRPCPSIEIEECSSLRSDHIYRSRVESLGTESIDLEKTFWRNLKSEPEEFFLDRRSTEKECLITRHDIRSSSIREEVERRYIFILFGQLLNHFCKKIFDTSLYTPPSIIPVMIDREDEHHLSCFFCAPHDEMSPKSDSRLWVIRHEP